MGFFNLDSRFFQTLGKFFFPGKLTEEYISGKRKKYINPARIFLFSLLFHFAALAFLVKGQNIKLGDAQNLKDTLHDSHQRAKFDELIKEIEIDSTQKIDSLRKRLFTAADKLDSDSIRLSQIGTITGFDYEDVPFALDDVVNMNENEFVEHYKIEGFKNKLITRQSIRIFRNPNEIMRFYIGNLIWAVALTVIFVSLFMKLLYIRRKKFFVEHLILLLHIHSFIFLITGVAIFIFLLDKNIGKFALLICSIVALLYFFLAMKKTYKQGIFKTFAKFCIIGMLYMFTISFFALIIFVFSMFIF